MTYRNLVVINGEKVDLKDLQPEERERLQLLWARRAAEAVGYREVKKDT